MSLNRAGGWGQVVTIFAALAAMMKVLRENYPDGKRRHFYFTFFDSPQ